MSKLVYLVVLGFIASISIWLNKYCESNDAPFRTAAFGAKVVLLLIMAINAAYSFSAMRELSLARKADAKRQEIAKESEHQKTEREKERTKQIESIATGAGRRAKYELSKRLNENTNTPEERVDDKPVVTEQTAFQKYENPLFWLMVIEAVAAGLCFVLMSGLKSLRQQSTQQSIEPVHYLTREEWEALSASFPKEQQKIIHPKYVGERTFKHNPDGSRTLVQSTYAEDEEELTPEEAEERERWRVIAEQRRAYGEQLRDKSTSKPVASKVPVKIESSESKPDDQLVNGKYRSH